MSVRLINGLFTETPLHLYSFFTFIPSTNSCYDETPSLKGFFFPINPFRQDPLTSDKINKIFQYCPSLSLSPQNHHHHHHPTATTVPNLNPNPNPPPATTTSRHPTPLQNSRHNQTPPPNTTIPNQNPNPKNREMQRCSTQPSNHQQPPTSNSHLVHGR